MGNLVSQPVFLFGGQLIDVFKTIVSLTYTSNEGALAELVLVLL